MSEPSPSPEAPKPPQKQTRLACRKCKTREWYQDPQGSGDFRCAGCGAWDFKSAREMTFKRSKPERRRRR